MSLSVEKWMKPIVRLSFRLSVLATLYLLAAPVYLALGALRLHRITKALAVIATGRVFCTHCGHENILNRFATCNRCKATEYSSILYCSFCRQVSRYLTCEGCSATLRVIPGVWR